MITVEQEEAFERAFKDLYHCAARHLETVPVVETFNGNVIWEGEVEVFNLVGHPETDTGYAWGYSQGGKFEITAVLKLPPAISPKTAVQTALIQKNRERFQN